MQYLKATSLANLYKYLTWKSLQNPLNRRKSLAGLLFLCKYINYESSRFQQRKLILILVLKIAIVLILGGEFSAVLFAGRKAKLLQNS